MVKPRKYKMYRGFRLELEHVARVNADIGSCQLAIYFKGLPDSPSLILSYPDRDKLMSAYDTITQEITSVQK